MERQDLIIRCGMLVGMFVFLALGALALGREPDFVFDRFLAAGFFLLFLLSYKRMGLKLPVLLVGVGALILHHLKLYGQTYFGWLQFDMVMHFVGAFALALILHQYLSTCEGIGCSGKAKVACLAVLTVAGLGTFIEITEFFGYANLGQGDGILYHGLGDGSGGVSDWWDTVSDMMCNLLGAIAGVIVMTLAHYVKRRNVKNLKLFLAS